MKYGLHSYGGKLTAVTAPDMQTALRLYLAVHPTDDYVVISRWCDGDKEHDHIVYLLPSEDKDDDACNK